MKHLLLLATCALALWGCSPDDEEKKAADAAQAFATAFAEYRLGDAAKLCDDEGKRHLAVIASNISNEDLDAINAADEPQVDIDNIELSGAEATAAITIKGWLATDSIEPAARHAKDIACHIPMTKANGKWILRFRITQLQRGE